MLNKSHITIGYIRRIRRASLLYRRQRCFSHPLSSPSCPWQCSRLPFPPVLSFMRTWPRSIHGETLLLPPPGSTTLLRTLRRSWNFVLVYAHLTLTHSSNICRRRLILSMNDTESICLRLRLTNLWSPRTRPCKSSRNGSTGMASRTMLLSLPRTVWSRSPFRSP